MTSVRDCLVTCSMQIVSCGPKPSFLTSVSKELAQQLVKVNFDANLTMSFSEKQHSR